MMADMNYDAMGRYIYGAARHGGKLADVERWMADDLGAAHPPAGDDSARGALYQAFFAKHASPEQLQDNHSRFMASLQERSA